MPGRPNLFRPRNIIAPKPRINGRKSARERGYSARWDKEARAYKFRHPLCIGCAALGLINAAQVVDHIIPHCGSAQLFWDRNNWQSSCAWHHDKVKQELERGYERGQIATSSLRLDGPQAVVLARTLIEAGEGP